MTMQEIIEKLPEEKFKEVLRSVPIVCVDTVLRNKEDKILLIKRREKPAEGEWWFPGGRLYKNERLIDCVSRKLSEEIGFECEKCPIEFIDAFETIFEDGPFGTQLHTVNLTYLVDDFFSGSTISINEEYASDYRWMTGNESFIGDYVKKIIKVVFEEM